MKLPCVLPNGTTLLSQRHIRIGHIFIITLPSIPPVLIVRISSEISFFVGLALQRLSDIICLEHGLSVIERKKPSERMKRTTYPEKKSLRDEIRETINQVLKDESIKDFDEFLHKLEDAGFAIKRGKHISIKGKNQKRFIRLRSLGEGYTEDGLKKILAGEMERAFDDNEQTEKQPNIYYHKKDEHEFDLLINIQKKLAQGKGQYYVRFAKNFNTKQVAKAVLF